jgi:NADH-quinone oxidoreductase subunit J
MATTILLLLGLLAAAVWTVMTTRLLRSVVGLALTSAILSIIIFQLNSPVAAVFELSVCAGLIPVIFITAISFTQRIAKSQLQERRRERLTRFFLLPVIVIIAGLALLRWLKIPALVLPSADGAGDVRLLFWNVRHLDLLGQIVVLLAGAFAVVVLFKEPRK